MISEQQPLVNNDHYFWVPRLVDVHKFDCMFISGFNATVCFTDLDQGSEMIIFESILTTLIANVIFKGGWVGQ